MLSLSTLLFPLYPDLLLEEITCEGRILFLTVRREAQMGKCPDCSQDSRKVHSRYIRTLADVSFMDYAVMLRVQVGRFFCSNPACARTTFAEAFANLTAPYARRTNRQVNRLRAIAKELGSAYQLVQDFRNIGIFGYCYKVKVSYCNFPISLSFLWSIKY